MLENDCTTWIRYRQVPGFPDYEVGDDGSVWSLRYGKRKRLMPREGRHGSLGVTLSCDGVVRQFKISRLVLSVFVGPCPDGMVCCHRDDNPANNGLENLRWDTPKGNSADAIRNGRMVCGSRHHSAKLTERDARDIRRYYAMGVTEEQLVIAYRVCRQTIAALLDGRTWKHVLEI